MAAAEIGSFPPGVKRFFLLGAPIIALIIYWILPNTYTDIHNQVLPFNPHAKACLAVVVWMVLWWLFEPVPIPVTSLLPIPLFPLLGIAKPAQAMAPYASGTIFLFMGGFLLASGVLSMWVSNTATAAMMVPIAMAVLSLVRAKKAGGPIDQEEENFSVAMLLAVAYGASIGGMATIIGSPPNGIFARFMEQNFNDPISLAHWMKYGMPLTLILLPLCWFLLTKVLFRKTMKEIEGGAQWVQSELNKLGPIGKGEMIVLIVFCSAILLWSFGGVLRGLDFGGTRPFASLSDAAIAMICAIVLFCIPVNRDHMVLDWSDMKELPWGVLLLFGGGLSMAAGLQITECGQIISANAGVLAGLPRWAILIGVSLLVMLASNFTSNTALAATLMPLLASAAVPMGVPAEQLLMVTALSASCAFMMPVGTPPNAIVFSTGRIKIMQMVSAGAVLTLVSVVVIGLFAATFIN
ncbi:SLC13 family permease [Parasutterella excrementihominis]|uniref:SLC13 family permease n=1 Tax=Parasutterella excrementihominis TaxID=487175 RepID=UPI003FEE0A4A